MTEFAVVIPVGAGRRENLTAVLESLEHQWLKPKVVILACDGPDAWLSSVAASFPVAVLHLQKHRPGMEQPRNEGVRAITTLRREKPDLFGEITHAAFLDSDVLVQGSWLRHYDMAIEDSGGDGIYYGPYDWLPEGKREIDPDFRNDNRWAMFNEASTTRFIGDLSKGLGCYSGNLVWNVDDFERVGGFWNEIHHGRCEDGELGLRAVAMGVPIGLVPGARGWHLWHGGAPEPTPEWLNYVHRINTIDVPKLKERHPWAELGNGGTELFVVEEDGRRFDARCVCGWEGNTALIWEHQAECLISKDAA